MVDDYRSLLVAENMDGYIFILVLILIGLSVIVWWICDVIRRRIKGRKLYKPPEEKKTEFQTPEEYILSDMAREIPGYFYGRSEETKTWPQAEMAVKRLLVVDKSGKILRRSYMIFRGQPHITGVKPRAFDVTIPGEEFEFTMENGELVKLGRPYFLEDEKDDDV